MSSKILEKYEELKKENKEKIFLFKSGNFYIAINEDATVLNKILGFKITNFSTESKKCGFPTSSLNKYKKVLLDNNVDFDEITNYTLDLPNKPKDLIEYIISIDINNIDSKEKSIEELNKIIKKARYLNEK